MKTEHDLIAALRTLEPSGAGDSALLRAVRRGIARRRILRAGALAGITGLAVAVIAAALVAGAAPGPGIAGGHHRPTRAAAPKARKSASVNAQTAAYIVQRAAAAEARTARMIQVIRDSAGVDYTSVATQQTLFLSSRHSANGRPLFASEENITGTAYTATDIDYKDRVYSVISASTLDGGPWGAKGIVIASWLPGVKASDPASAYAAALRAGTIRVLGYRTLDGRLTILIQTTNKPMPDVLRCPARHPGGTPAGYSPSQPMSPCNQPPRPASCKLPPPAVNEVWLDASTYLDVQEATLEPATAMHSLRRPHITWACYTVTGWSATTTSVDWLPPTKKTLALLHLTPPAGFTEVSSQQMAQYLGPYS